MDSDALQRKIKWQREVLPTVADIMLSARRQWEKSNPYKRNSSQQEDALFRESFGCGPLAVLAAWSMPEKQGHMPPGGTIEHFLWTLQFMKVYGKTPSVDSVADRNQGATSKRLTEEGIFLLRRFSPVRIALFP
jgi:hypothetical protein